MTDTDTIRLNIRLPIHPDWLRVYFAAASDDAPCLKDDHAIQGLVGPAGWGWAASNGQTGQGWELNTTNGRAALMAVVDAMDCLDDGLMFITDNPYVYGGFKFGWWFDWKQYDWVAPDGTPTPNSDLWKPVIDETYEGRTDFRWAIDIPGNPDLAIANQLASADEFAFAKKLAQEAKDRATDLI